MDGYLSLVVRAVDGDQRVKDGGMNFFISHVYER
jgi:hypothetical protein